MKAVLRTIDKISNAVGNSISYLVPVMSLLMVIEVIARYLFQRPTQWVWPIDTQLMVIVFGFAGCYTMLNQMHVRVDVVYSKLSPKKRAILDIITLIFAIFFLIALLWVSIEMGWSSALRGESDQAGFEPPIWHLKLVVIPIGIVLMLLQTIANFVRDCQIIFKGRQQ